MPVNHKQYEWSQLADIKPRFLDIEFLGLYEMLDMKWKNWTPTYDATGSMTWTSITTQIARYFQVGNTVYFQITATGTTGGTANTSVTFTLPVRPVQTTTSDFGGGCLTEDAVEGAGAWRWTSADRIRVFKYDGTNWGLGAGRKIIVQGFYETR